MEEKKPQEILISKAAFDFLAGASQATFPREFLGLLRKNSSGAISEILVFPQTINGENFSAINQWMVPYSANSCGSVHSHPGRSALPSEADLDFFSRSGEIHLIIAYPFDFASLRAYDSKGKQLRVRLTEPERD